MKRIHVHLCIDLIDVWVNGILIKSDLQGRILKYQTKL